MAHKRSKKLKGECAVPGGGSAASNSEGPASEKREGLTEPLLGPSITLQRLQEQMENALKSLVTLSKKLQGGEKKTNKKPKHPVGSNSEELGSDGIDPIDRYALVNKLRRPNAATTGEATQELSAEERRACMNALLRWVDEAKPFDSASFTETSREKLVDHLLSKPKARVKRRRASTDADDVDAKVLHHWKHYETQLNSAYEAETAVLKRLREANVSVDLCSPPILVKVEGTGSEGIVPPAATSIGLQGNLTQLNAAKDALAECQRGVTSLLSLLEKSLDDYTEQMQSVAEQERMFWNNVMAAEIESQALLSLSCRVKKLC
uniref:Uncharacterized protein n=1 Tax=Trypanosoma congolense (strain IL3000) TaxID=1068625 RepID=G0UK17_TRYCI|nr:conserved hypothetical protein [Trypanosoma congolense IL3000]